MKTLNATFMALLLSGIALSCNPSGNTANMGLLGGLIGSTSTSGTNDGEVLPAPNELVANRVTIHGTGFSDFMDAEGSGTGVRAKTESGAAIIGTVVSWTDSQIVVDFSAIPVEVTVHTVFGSGTIPVTD